MRTIWHSLAWKEWHEHKWKLASVTAVLAATASVPLLHYERESLSAGVMMAILCVVPLAVFIGTGTAAGERARGTLAFTQALPVPLWKVALQKLLFGLFTCTLPVFAVVALLLGVYYACLYFHVDPRPRLGNPWFDFGSDVRPWDWLAVSLTAGISISVSLFLWTTAFGVNRRDEVSAGAWGLLATAAWWTVWVVASTWLKAPDDRLGHFLGTLLPAAPGGLTIMSLNENGLDRVWQSPALALATATYVLLGAIYVLRFGRNPGSEIASPAHARGPAGATNWLGQPRSSPLTAVAWKQFRESGAIVLAALAGVAAMSCVLLVSSPMGRSLRSAVETVAVLTVYIGLLSTLVVGIGAFLNDLSPALNTFWRSRPINPHLWFWSKYATGFAVLAATFGLPLLALLFTVGFSDSDANDALPYFVIIPLFVYSAAVLMTCLLRHAIYAAVLSIGALYLGFFGVLWVVRAAQLVCGMIDWNKALANPTTIESIAALIFSSFAFTLLAWLAVRNDWGWKKG